MKWFEQDTEEALALLNEAGFDFTQEIQLAYQNSPMETLYSPGGLAQMVKDQLAEIGVKVIMRPLPAEELKSSLAAGDEMFFIDWYAIDYLDGVAFFDKPFISEAQRFGQPYSNLQAFIKNVRGISNLDRKQLLFDKMNQAVLDEVPLIPLGHSPSLTVFRSSLQNISSNAYYENIEQIVSDKEIIRFIGPSEPLSLWPADETTMPPSGLRASCMTHCWHPGSGAKVHSITGGKLAIQ